MNQSRPIDTIRVLSEKMGDALLDRESIFDGEFISVIGSINEILGEYDQFSHLRWPGPTANDNNSN